MYDAIPATHSSVLSAGAMTPYVLPSSGPVIPFSRILMM